jgi:hypothetical protein
MSTSSDVDHGLVRSSAVLFPEWAAVERRERRTAGGVVAEAAYPYEPVGVVEVPELPYDVDAHRFLGLDQLPIEQLDQRVAPARVQRVLA